MESFEDSETSKDMNGFLLIFKKNGFEGTTYSLPEGITTIGASSNADIRIKLKDSRIEDIHCAIKVNQDGIATIINKANKHPIMVNNSIVNRGRILRNEDFIEVVFKKFQYKNDFLTDQDIDAATQKLLSRSDKTSILKKKSAIPRCVTERKPIIVTKALRSSAASKRRLSLQVSDQSQLQSRIGKIGTKTPQLPRINIRRSSLNHADCFRNSSRKSIRNSNVKCKISLTRRSKNRIASDESENLRISSQSTCSPLEELSTSETDAENEVFINQIQVHSSAACVIGNIASLEYLLTPTRLNNLSQTDSKDNSVSSIRISSVGRNLSNSSQIQTYSTNSFAKENQMLLIDQESYEVDGYQFPTKSDSARKSIETRKSVIKKETQNEGYNDFKNVPIRLLSARKSAQNKSQIQTPGSKRSVENKCTPGPDNYTNNATQSEDSDEYETEESISPLRLSSPRESIQNRSQIQTPGSRRSITNQSTAGRDNSTNNSTQSEDSDEFVTEENVSPTKLSSTRKSAQNISRTQTPGFRRSIKNQSTAGPDNSLNNATQSEESDEFVTEENISPIRLSSARKSPQNKSQIQTPGSKRSVENKCTPGPDNSTKNAAQSEDSDEYETEESISPSRLSSLRESIQNRSQIQTPGSRRSIKNKSTAGRDNSTNNSTQSEDSDEFVTEENVSPTKLSSTRKSAQNISQIQTPGFRRSIKNQSTAGPDNSLNNATQSEESDEFVTEENISPIRLSSARKSAQNKSQIQTSGSKRSVENKCTPGPDNYTNNATQSEDSDEYETEGSISPLRLSSARKSTQNRSQIQATGSRRSIKNQSIVGPDNSTINNIDTTPSEDSDESETEENVSPTRLSSARKSIQNRSQIQTPGARRSIKNQSIVGPDNSTNNATQSEESDKSKTEENVAPTRLSSARKSTQNRSQIQATGSRRSIKNQSIAGPDNSMLKNMDTRQNEDFAESETEESISSTRLSSAKKSKQNRSQIQATGSRRSIKNQSIVGPDNSTKNATQSEDSDEYETEESISPSRLSSLRESIQNRSQIQTPGSRRSIKNQSTAGRDNSTNNSTQSEDSDEFVTEENVSPTKLSPTRKSAQNISQIQTPGFRRSIKNQSTAGPDNSMNNVTQNEESDEFVTEENVSPTRLSSARKSVQNRSQVQTPGSRRSIKNQSIVGPDNSTNNATQSEESDKSKTEENVAPTRLSSARKSTQNRSQIQATGSRRSIKNQSIVGPDNSTIKNIDTTPSEDSDESETEENVSPKRLSSARKRAQNKSQIQTPDSRISVKNQSSLIDLVSPIRMLTNVEISFDTSVNNDTISARASSGKKSLLSRSNIQTPHTRRSMQANQSIDLSRSLFEQNLSPSKMSSVRKSKANISSNRNNRTSKLVHFDINSLDVDDGNVNIRNRELVELNPVNTSKSKRDNITSAELEKTISLSNLEDNSTKRSSRKRKSTLKDDFIYGSFLTHSSNVVTTNKFDCTTIPLETSVDNISDLTNDDELSVNKALSENETCSTSYRDSLANVIGKSTVNNSVIDLTTPKSPVGRRKKSLPYQPITEDITPGTPVGTTESDEGFKTPLNTPHLFKSIRKSVLQSRQQRNSDKLTEKATKRPRESTSSTSRSNKRIKLTINEDDTYEEQPSLFASFTSDDIFEEDDPYDIVAGTPKHIVELTEKPVVTYPTTNFSTEFQQTKTGAVRRSFPSADQIIRKSTRRSLQINTLSSVDVGHTISESAPLTKTRKLQKEPENDLTDVKGVKKLLSTPKVQNPPKNDLIDIPPIKKLLATPRNVKSPKNDLTEIPNLRRIMSPKQQNTPNNDLTDVRGVRKLMRTPATQKQPRNDLSDVEGVSNIFNASVHHRLSNASDIENNEDLFDKIFNKKMLKTYRSKSTSPLKRFDAYGVVRKSVGDVPMINPRVSMWVNEQEELKKKVVGKTGRKGGKKGVEDIQSPSVSSTKRRIYGDGDKERTNSETTDNTEDSDKKTRKKKVVLSKEDSPIPVRGRRNAIKKIEEIEDTATLDSPKPVRGRRNAIKKIEEIEDTETLDSPKPVRGRRNAIKKIEEIENTATLDSPKPVRGRPNAIKKLEEIENTVTLDLPKPVRGRRNAIKKIEEIEDTATLDSPKPVRGRRNAIKKTEEIEDTETLDSPKPVRGRRNAIKKIEEIEDTATLDSPKPVRGRRNAIKKTEEIEDTETLDSPKPVRGRRNAIKKIEDTATLDSPKPVRGRRNAIKKIEEIENTATLDSPKPVRGRPNAINKIEDTATLDSPKPVRGRRNAIKKNEDTATLDSPKPVRGRRNAIKKIEEEIVDRATLDSPKPVRGRRNANKKIEKIEDTVTVSPKPVGARRNAAKNKGMKTDNTEDPPKGSTRGRRKKNAVETENMVDLNNTNEENENDVEEEIKNSPVVARGRRNKRNVESVEEFEEKAVSGKNKRKTTRKNSLVDTPTDSETEVEVRRGRKKAVNLEKRKVDVESSVDIEEKHNDPKNKRVKLLKKVEEVVEAPSPSTITTRSRRNADVNEKDEGSVEPAKKTRSKKEVKKSTRGKKVDSDISESPQVSAKTSTRQKKVRFQ